MKKSITKLLLLLLIFSSSNSASQEISFYKDIVPILSMHCNSCHGKNDDWWKFQELAGDLVTRDYKSLMSGGTNGPAIIPFNSRKSLLVRRIEEKSEVKMPLFGKELTREQVDKIKQWIDEGAKEGVDTIPKEFIQIDSIQTDNFSNTDFDVYCRATQPCYLVVDVINPNNEEILLSKTATIKWEKDYGDATKPGHFINWFMKAEKKWPEIISVRLTYSYPNKIPSNTVFFIPYKEPWPYNDNDGNDHGVSNFAPDPIRPPKNNMGLLSFWLNSDCDVDVIISQTKANTMVYRNLEQDLERGLNKITWDIQANKVRVKSGSYYARLRCNSKGKNEPQYDMAILFTVKRDDE